MRKKLKKIAILLTFTSIYITVNAQSSDNAAWFFITHTQKLSKKWKALADVQLRTGDQFVRFKTLLLRGAIGYTINNSHSLAFGYAYKSDWPQDDLKSRENRIYQQYLFEPKINQTKATLRLRQEQRFVKEYDKYMFSQRTRLLLGVQIPLVSNSDFSKGMYATIQNELFLNTQHKGNVNNSFFDQNRPFISIGYRWNKKIDSELGYMYWFRKEKDNNATTNVIQLMLTTDF